MESTVFSLSLGKGLLLNIVRLCKHCIRKIWLGDSLRSYVSVVCKSHRISLLMIALFLKLIQVTKSICVGQNPIVCPNHKSIGYSSY